MTDIAATGPAHRLGAAGRRALDLLIAIPALVLLSPLLAVIAVLIRRGSPGPAIFRQERVGRFEEPFTIYKFRTMRQGLDDAEHRAFVTRMLTGEAERSGGENGLYKLQNDPRITPIGAFLRRLSLDELPQLINVVKGDMAIVGPRPVLPWEAQLFEPRYRARFAVRPGLTGLWQVSGRAALTMREALDLDLRYVEERRLGLDLSIIAKTVPTVLFGRLTS